MSAKYDALIPPALKRLVGSGAVLKAVSSEIMEACRKSASEVYDDIPSKNQRFKKIYDQFVAFRND